MVGTSPERIASPLPLLPRLGCCFRGHAGPCADRPNATPINTVAAGYSIIQEDARLHHSLAQIRAIHCHVALQPVSLRAGLDSRPVQMLCVDCSGSEVFP